MTITIPPSNFGSTGEPIIVVEGASGERSISIGLGPDLVPLGSTKNEKVEITAPAIVHMTAGNTRFRINENFSGNADAFETLLQKGGTPIE